MNPIEFSQEYECRFMEEELALFTPSIVEPCINRSMRYVFSLETNNAVYMGIDFAKIQDETCISVVEHNYSTNKVTLRYRQNLKKIPYDKQLMMVQDIDRKFRCDKINMDATGVGVRLFEEMEKVYGGKVEGVKFTPDAKHSLVNGLRLLFQNQRMEIPFDEVLMSQLYAMERVQSDKSDIVKYKSVGSKMDDTVWSLAMACKDCFGLVGGVHVGFGENAVSHEMNQRISSISASKHDPYHDEFYNAYF